MLFTRYLGTVHLELEWIMCILCCLLLAPSILSVFMAENSFNSENQGFVRGRRKNDTFLAISESVLSHTYSKRVNFFN